MKFPSFKEHVGKILIEEPLEEAQDYRALFGKYALDPKFKSPSNTFIDDNIRWAKGVLKKQDRIVWFLRFEKLALMSKEDPEDFKKEFEKIKSNPSKDFLTRPTSNHQHGLPQRFTWQKFVEDPFIYCHRLTLNLEHYIGQEEEIPEFKNIIFKYQTPEELFGEFSGLELEHRDKVADEKRLIPLEETDKIIIKFPDDYAWIDIDKSYCEKEGQAMGHCGNVEGKHRTTDRILSLNKIIKKGNITYRQPHLTFILMEGGILGETKGRANERPAEKYYKYIIPLLEKTDLIKGANPEAGYLPSSNFHLSDLPEEEFKRLLKLNPALGTLDDVQKEFGIDSKEYKTAADKLLQLRFSKIPDSPYYILNKYQSLEDLISDLPFSKTTLDLLHRMESGDQDDYDYLIHSIPEEKYIRDDIQLYLDDELEPKVAEYYGLDSDNYDPDELYDKVIEDTDLMNEIQNVYVDSLSGSLSDNQYRAVIEWVGDAIDSLGDLPIYAMYKSPLTDEIEIFPNPALTNKDNKVPRSLIYEKHECYITIDYTSANFPKFWKGYGDLIERGEFSIDDLNWETRHLATDVRDPDIDNKVLKDGINSTIRQYIKQSDPRQQDLQLSQYELDEATAEEVHTKYYTDIPKETFDVLYKADPTAKDNKLGQYSKWIIEKYKKLTPATQKRFISEDLPKLTDALTTYHKAKTLNKIDKKDINAFKTMNDLYDYLESKNINADELKSKAEIDKEIKDEGAEKVFENDEWRVIVPETNEAACFYGAGSKWCTASPSSRYFDQYSAQGPLYIIISKKEKDASGRALKFQFHFQSNQYMDNSDRPVAHGKDEALSWIRDNMGDDAGEFFKDKTLSAFQKLVDVKGHRDPEVIEAAKKIIKRRFRLFDDSTVEYDTNSDIQRLINSVPGEGTSGTAVIDDLYGRISSDILLGDLDSEIINDLVSNFSEEQRHGLAKFYHMDENKYSSVEEFEEALTDEIYADEDLMKEIRKVYKSIDKNKVFVETRELFFEQLINAVCGFSFWDRTEDEYGESTYYPNVYIKYELNGTYNELTSESPTSALTSDMYITLIDISDPIELAIILDNDNWEIQNYYDGYEAKKDMEKLPEIDFDSSTIVKKIGQVIDNHLGKGAVEHEKQLDLDLSQFNLVGFKDFLKEE